MENPLLKIRKQRGLSVADMGVFCGVSMMTIQRIEKGSLIKVTPKVLNALEKWGYDRSKFESDYKKWKEHRVKQLETIVS